MSFRRSRTQVLHRYLPGALFVHDTYGVGLVTAVDLDPAIDVNQRALGEALIDYLRHWEASFRAGFPDNGATGDLGRFYRVGSPRRVRFRPFPDVFECMSCQRVCDLTTLRGASVAPGRCLTCGAGLRQLRYVEAHPCGRILPLVIPRCSTHGRDHLRLETTGRFRNLAWRCLACGDAFVQGTRNRMCACAYSKRLPANSSGHLMRSTVVTDPSLAITHTVPFVNLPSAQFDALLHDPDGRLLALAASCGMVQGSVLDLARRRAGVRSEEEQTMLSAFVAQLRASGLDETFIQAQLRQLQTPDASVTAALDTLAQVWGSSLGDLRATIPRRIIEHAAIVDSSDARTIAALQADLRAVGDGEGAQALDVGLGTALAMGIRQIRVLDAFPIALMAVGFTRLSRGPAEAVLTPFASVPGDNRVPLYVVANTTEAIYVQLDPGRVLAWLARNDRIPPATPIPVDPTTAWMELYRAVPGLLHLPSQPHGADEAAVATRMLLHTVSHVLLAAIGLSGYEAAAIGEYLFPENLAVVLYANRFEETRLGGLITLVERSLEPWLRQAWDARSCLYDPVCGDAGGSCVGCVQREHGCVGFNEELSRAALFGGMLPLGAGDGRAVVVRDGYWDGWQTHA